MFPLSDDNPTLRMPLVTIAIIAMNAAAWFFVQGLGVEPALSHSVCVLGLIPGELLGLAQVGTRVPIGPQTACVLGGQPGWYTPVTSMFMHGGWFHVLGNLWFLWVFGNNVEDAMGRLRFVVFYLLCGLAAAAAQTIANPASPIPMVGASGAIGGVMGAYAVLYPKARVALLVIFGFFVRTIWVPAIVMLGYWFVIQLVGGAVDGVSAGGGGVAFWAHIGGFAAGVLLIFGFRNPALVAAHRRRHRRRRY